MVTLVIKCSCNCFYHPFSPSLSLTPSLSPPPPSHTLSLSLLPLTLSLSSSSLSPTFLSFSFHLHHDQRLILGGSFVHLVHQFPHNPIKWNIEGGCSLKEKRKMHSLEAVWYN